MSEFWCWYNKELCGPRSSLKFNCSCPFPFDGSLDSQLVFHFDVAICAGHSSLPCLCFSRKPQGHNLSVVLWTGDEKCGDDAQPPVRGKRAGMSRWKPYRGHVCISDWELSQTDATESYQDICNFCKKGKRQWNRNTPGRDQTPNRLRGTSTSFTLDSLSVIGSVWPNYMSKDCLMPPQIMESCFFFSLELKKYVASGTTSPSFYTGDSWAALPNLPMASFSQTIYPSVLVYG